MTVYPYNVLLHSHNEIIKDEGSFIYCSEMILKNSIKQQQKTLLGKIKRWKRVPILTYLLIQALNITGSIKRNEQHW